MNYDVKRAWDRHVNRMVCARGQVSNEFLFGAFAWAVKVRPQVLLSWSQQDGPGLSVSLTRRPRNPSEGTLCRLCYRMSVGAGERRREGERRDEIIAAAQGGIRSKSVVVAVAKGQRAQHRK